MVDHYGIYLINTVYYNVECSLFLKLEFELGDVHQ